MHAENTTYPPSHVVARFNRAYAWVCMILICLGAPVIICGLVLGGALFWALPQAKSIGIAVLFVVLALVCFGAFGSVAIIFGMGFVSLLRRGLRGADALWTDAHGIHGYVGLRGTLCFLAWPDVGRIELVEHGHGPLLIVEHRTPAEWARSLPRWVRWIKHLAYRRSNIMPVLVWSEGMLDRPLPELGQALVELRRIQQGELSAGTA